MTIDSRNLETGHSVQTDICIIGAGAAGLTLAKELAGSGRSVLLMESGGLEPEEAVDDMKRGTLEGPVFEKKPQYLSTERVRFFGGTTNVWEGLCEPLMAIDFEKRSWMPESGWPITREDLDPYYIRAANHIGIHPYNTVFPKNDEMVDCKLLPDGGEWDALTLHMATRPRLVTNFEKELKQSANISIYIHANAVVFNEDENRQRIESVEFETLSGTRFTVKAQDFVLAAGGIENSRILLNSNIKTGGAVGNRHDNLGRYWMDQLHIPGGRLCVPNPLEDHNLYYRTFSKTFGYIKMGGIGMTPEAQRANELSNQALIFDVASNSWYSEDSVPFVKAFSSLLDNDVNRRSGATFDQPKEYWFRFKSELTVDRENRVTLGDDVDALGMRRLHLKWEIAEQDRIMMVRFAEKLADAVGEHFVGRVLPWYHGEEELPKYSNGHGHQLGGTRMTSDPSRGVVDGDCRVHGTKNLFIVGGSVFPSGGRTNPTLTVIALAIRLAEKLKETA